MAFGPADNWPVPSVTESTRPWAIARDAAPSAPGNRNTGLMLLDLCVDRDRHLARSGKRDHVVSWSPREPVKPTAWIAGCRTSALPTVPPLPISSEKTPSGRPQSAMAFCMTRPTNSDVPGCDECALATTGAAAGNHSGRIAPGQNANGKLLALKTATGPDGNLLRAQVGTGYRDQGARGQWSRSASGPRAPAKRTA